MKRKALVTFAFVLLLSSLVLIFGRTSIESQYKGQGFQMVNGCNGGAAVGADGEVHAIEQRLAWLRDTPEANTNVIIQLQKAYILAQEKARILGDDCRRRGHRDTHPWKTNWTTIKQALTASEKELEKW